jgi:hypothetical protein
MRTVLLLSFLPWIALAGGCRLLDPAESSQGHSPLQPAQSSPDSVALEIIWARFPMNDPQLSDTMWQEIDETQLSPAVRRELANNGFRVGVVGGTLPDAIAELLAPAGPPVGEAASATKSSTEPGADDGQNPLLAEPTIRRRVLQLRRGRRAEVQASEVYGSLPLLVYQDRELGGRTYRDAQAMFGLRVDPQPDQTAIVELTPELHYGAARLRWTSEDEGILRQAPLRNREIFTALRISTPLAAGEMLVLTSMPDVGSRLGHYFHTVNAADGQQQKLILIRLAQVPPSRTFEADDHR